MFSVEFAGFFACWWWSLEGRGNKDALRADVAFECPRPPLQDLTKEIVADEAKSENPPTPVKVLEGSSKSADFFGASPVASALGIRPGATPFGTGMPEQHRQNKLRGRLRLRHPAAAQHRRSGPCVPPSTARRSWRVYSPCAECPWWPDKDLAAPSHQTAAASHRLL